MRLKAVPQEAVKLLSNKWVLIGGAVALAGGAFLVMRGGAADAATGDGTPYSGMGATYMAQDPTSAAAAGGTDPALLQMLGALTGAIGGTQGGAGGGVVGGTVDQTPINVQYVDTGEYAYAQDLLKFEAYKFDKNWELGLAELQLTSDIALANANLGFMSIASSNYATSALLAMNFTNSDKQASIYSLSTGVPGGDINFAGINAKNSDKNGWNSNLVRMIDSGTFAKFQQQTAPRPVTTPSPGYVPPNINSGSYQPSGVLAAAAQQTASYANPSPTAPPAQSGTSGLATVAAAIANRSSSAAAQQGGSKLKTQLL